MQQTDNSYYTPELEELYGVDEIYFRHFGSMDYVKENINPLKLKDHLTAVLDHKGKETETFLVPESLKLKYLDKEDIESLGFKPWDDYIYPARERLGFIYNNPHLKYEVVKLIQVVKSGTLLIYYDNGSGGTTNLFAGQCKNIHKLKQILKDVGITD